MKALKGYYLSPVVVKELAVRAAISGQNLSDIVETALRKHLQLPLRDVDVETLWAGSYGEITDYIIGSHDDLFCFAWSDGTFDLTLVPDGDFGITEYGAKWFDSLEDAIEYAVSVFENLEADDLKTDVQQVSSSPEE